MIIEPTVTLWAYTTLDVADHATNTASILEQLPPPGDVNELFAADYLAEAAGRACYQSWDRPNAKTASNQAYLAHILDVRHFSVLSHASATFYIEGVSRTLSHELIRHRFLAFSQLSQRYVDGKKMDWVCPPIALRDSTAQAIMEQNFQRAVNDYESLSERLATTAQLEGYSGTLTKKRAREAARAVLPNETETKIVVSGNHRAWRDFLAQRWTESADLEIQRLAGIIGERLMELAPSTFADFDFSKPAA
jgi:thymidylate synthase (FAD)